MSVHWRYVVPWKSGRTATERLIRLHVLLCEQFPESLVSTQRLVARHNERFPAHPCGAMDAERSMAEVRHLFLRVTDLGWTAIGSAGTSLEALVAALASASSGDPEPAPGTHPDTSDRPGAALPRRLSELLTENGPMTTAALKRRLTAEPGFDGSTNSVSPWLLNSPAFRRVAPGVFALSEHDVDPVYETSSALLDETACRLFVLARHAGEPRTLYPLWTPAMEHAWCVWAEQSASPGLFRSLLAAIEPATWPVSRGERAAWRNKKRGQGRYELARTYRPLRETPPTLETLLAIAVYVRQAGFVSWITANRVAGARLEIRGIASALALLVGLNVLVPANDWQGRHRAGARVGWIVKALLEERHQAGSVTWSSALGRLLLYQLGYSVRGTRLGWVEPRELGALVDVLRSSEGVAAHPGGYRQNSDLSPTSEPERPVAVTRKGGPAPA